MKTLTICGSMRFFDQMLVVANELTRRGNIVLMPYVIKAEKDKPVTEHYCLKAGTKVPQPATEISNEYLDAMHLLKIDMSSGIVVVSDSSGYFGGSTSAEIGYAQNHDVDVSFAKVNRHEYKDYITFEGLE